MNKILLVLIVALYNCIIVKAQQDSTSHKRPKVGLVLSGGGAKGLAHIGVIKVLEEAGIKPDYIAGTSMGSIIGGLYASGYTPAELDSIVRAVDWSVVLSDNVPLTDVVPIEKNDYNRFQLEFDITKNGLKIPSGVVRGQRISELLSKLTWNVSDIENFDDLPIPFRCVAADLISGKTHVFDSGDLMIAMRASMAIPTVFTPVEIDSMYLVDGGVLDNFPVKTAINMGADIIIGVNVGFKDYPKKEDLNSLPKVLLNAASIVSNTSTVDNIELTDYIISPNLEPDYTTSSFEDGVAIMERGEEAARKQFAAFKHLADSLDEIGPYENHNDIPNKEKIKISNIEIKNRKNISTQYFYTNLGIEPGDTISPSDINQGMRQLMGTRFFNKITYEINKSDDDYQLIFNTEEAYPSKAKFSLHYDDELKAGIMTNLSFTNLLFNNSRLSLTMDVSEAPRLAGNLVTYVAEDRNIGILNDVYFQYTPFPIYNEESTRYGTFNYISYEASLGLLWNFQRSSMLTFKANWEEIVLKEKSGLSEIFEYGVNNFGLGLFKGQTTFEINTLNKRFFATSGQQLRLTINSIVKSYEKYSGTDEGKALIEPLIYIPNSSYLSSMLDWQRHFMLSKSLHLSTQLTAGAFSHTPPFADLFFVGGTIYNQGIGGIPFAGLNFREKIIENFGLLRTEFNYQISKNIYGHLIVNGIYAANFGGQNFESLSILVHKRDYLFGASIGIAINSFLGPITLGLGSNNTDHKLRGYFSIGFPFQ